MAEPVQHPPVWHGLTAGASSAVVSRLFTYPPDTVKARLQVQSAAAVGGPAYRGTLHAFAHIARTEGLAGFYRGFGAILLTVVPANACYFSGYELGKRITPRNYGVLSDLLTATIAQTVAGVVYCPIDIVKQRVQTATVLAPGAGPRPTPLSVATEVWRGQGVRGFFRGYMAMNTLWYPWNAIYLTMYEASKRRIYTWQLKKRRAEEAAGVGGGGGGAHGRAPPVTTLRGGVELLQSDPPMQLLLPLWSFPLCSASCAAVAAVATHPIDVVKTRFQVLSATDYRRERSALSVARDLLRSEGARGFTRGMAARVLTLSTGSSVSWFIYETVKRQLSAPGAAL